MELCLHVCVWAFFIKARVGLDLQNRTVVSAVHIGLFWTSACDLVHLEITILVDWA